MNLLIYHSREVMTFGAVQHRLLKPAGAPVGFLSPTSGPGGGCSPSFSPLSQKQLFFIALTPFVASGLFAHGDLPICRLILLLRTSKLWGHQWSPWTLLHNNLLKDGISISDSARHSPAPLSKLVRAQGPEAKLIVHKLIQPPWFCLFKWDS